MLGRLHLNGLTIGFRHRRKRHSYIVSLQNTLWPGRETVPTRSCVNWGKGGWVIRPKRGILVPQHFRPLI